LTRDVAVQVSLAGSYRPPELRTTENPSLFPPQMTMRLPVQTAEWSVLAIGALTVEVGIQVSLRGSYWPPVLKMPEVDPLPPQIIMRFPVQTAVCL